MLKFTNKLKNGEITTYYRIRKNNKYIKVDKTFSNEKDALQFEKLVLESLKLKKTNENNSMIELSKEDILEKIKLTDEFIILEDLYIQLYKKCSSYQDFFNNLGLIYNAENFYKFKKIFKKHGFNDNKDKKHQKIDYEKEMFIENSPFTRGTVKRVILRLKLIKYECAGCNNPGLWNGKPLTLQIEHKNGLPNDHRLENLEFLCPNCHSQTETYAARNKEDSKIKTNILPKNEIEKKLLETFKNNNQNNVDQENNQLRMNKIDICKEYAKSRGGECLSDSYVNSVTKLEWKCDNPNHKSWFSNWEHTVKRNRWCPECGIEISANKNRLLVNGLKKAQNFAFSKNGKLLSTEYTNNQMPLKWKCCNETHEPFTLTWSSVNKGSWCSECKKDEKLKNEIEQQKEHSIDNPLLTEKNKIILERAKRYAISKGGECISNFITSSTENLLWKCKNPKHFEFKGKYSYIVNDHHWCPECKE